MLFLFMSCQDPANLLRHLEICNYDVKLLGLRSWQPKNVYPMPIKVCGVWGFLFMCSPGAVFIGFVQTGYLARGLGQTSDLSFF